jgi:ribosome maturation factor RimP
MSDAVVAKVTQIAERVARSEGLEIVDVELLGGGKKRLLRIYIDKPGGVSHADCETVSQQVGTILDVEDVIPGGSYTLEVSSPGLERKLTKAKDFERMLAGFSGETITLEPEPGRSIRFALNQVAKANLKFDW